VVSDGDIVLMNAINVVFSEAAHLLCRFHIDKNVKAKCKMIVHPKEACDQVMKSWGAIVNYHNVESYVLKMVAASSRHVFDEAICVHFMYSCICFKNVLGIV